MYPSILIDEHEFNTADSFGYEFHRFLNERMEWKRDHYEIKLKGDHYILFDEVRIVNLNNIGDIVCGNTVIEIKNEDYSNDYTISMQSGHLDEQMDAMFENPDYTYKYLFVLGEIKDNDFYFTKLQCKHITGRCFNTAEQLMYWILYTCHYNNSGITPHVSFKLPEYHPAWSFLKNIPGVGKKKSEAIVKTLFHVHSLEDLMNLTIKDFKGVKGIGTVLATTIYNYIHNKPVNTLLYEFNSTEYRSNIWRNLQKEGGEI